MTNPETVDEAIAAAQVVAGKFGLTWDDYDAHERLEAVLTTALRHIADVARIETLREVGCHCTSRPVVCGDLCACTRCRLLRDAEGE